MGSLTERILGYDRQLEAVCQEHYPETALLRQVKGIGMLTALTFVLTLEDPHCFEKSRTVGAYLGFVPGFSAQTVQHHRHMEVQARVHP
jgi:transposase